MSGPYVIGIDQGTQSTKSIIFDADGKPVSEASQAVALHTPKPNWVEQDPEEIYQSVQSTVRRAVIQSGIDPKHVKGISLDSQICSMVRIDENWNYLGRLESYLDTRCQLQRDAMLEKYGDLIMDRNGIYPYIGPKLLWWKENDPAEYGRTCKALQVNGYIGGRLAGLKGEAAYVDRTCMGAYGWCDIRSFAWLPDLADKIGIDIDMSPRPVGAEEIVGELTAEAAKACGLVPGIPIVAGLGDAIAGWVGVGAVEPGILVDTSGTANHLGLCSDRYQPDLTHNVLTHYPSPIPGQWYPIGYTAGSGRSHSWFIDEFCLSDGERDDKERSKIYAALEKAASDLPPGSEGLVFVPHLGGRVCPYQPNVRGVWLGMTWKHTRAHLYRTILESIAYEYYSYLKVVRELYPELSLKRVVIIGGGAKSLLWTQIKADILGIPHVTCTDRSDFAPLGAAIVAGYAVGVYPDIAGTAKRFTKVTQNVEPQQACHDAYHPYAEFYVNLFKQMAPVFNDLADLAARPFSEHS